MRTPAGTDGLRVLADGRECLVYPRSLVVASAVALAALACRGEPTAPTAEISRVGSAARPLEGWFHIVWVDPSPPIGPGLVRYDIVDAQGHATELELEPGLAARWGGPRGLNQRKVRVDGHSVASGRLRVRSIEPVAGPAGAAPAAVQIGSHPYVTILCKFSDIAAERHTVATYTAWTAGTTYPGLDHYWRELSYDQMNVTGSTVVGWYTLPHPLSYYMDGDWLRLDDAASDCTSAADPDVDFPRFYGINLQFNGATLRSFGGSWELTADGQTKRYGMTWLQSTAPRTEYAHEEGHTLGLDHSSGPYGQTYDSRWDVMSRYVNGNFGPDGYGVPQHTISYHKDLLGWIPSARKVTVGPNTRKTITLERLAQPGSGNYLMATIPISTAPGQFYTVEARRRVGYDDFGIPGDAVVLHRVDPNPDFDRKARVVDVDNNGDPNDAGAMWTAGETFTDAANGITVTVDAQTATGFQVTITRGASTNSWVSRASMAKARSAFALALAGGRLYAIGGRSGAATLAAMEAYNPTTNSWAAKAALPSARYDGDGAVAGNGLVYLPGGRNSAGTLTKTLSVYTLATNVWSTKASLPITSGCGASVMINGLLYVVTGCDGTSGFKARLHRYSPSSNTWTARASAPSAHGSPAVGVINGKLYVAGGLNAAGTAVATLHVYDPGTNTWSTKAPMPSARFRAAAQVINGKLYVVGGTNAAGGVLAATLVYDPATNQWSTKAPMPTARTRLGVAMINNQLYAVGGWATNDLAKVERYTP
jgi:M6 family metalloprotease-like protein